MAERIIYDGAPGERWTNDTGKVQYQFIAALINTCGVCLQYHLKIGAWWPIPIHYGCRCEQRAIKPDAQAPHDFVDYRELLDKMPPAEQAAAIGASNYRLLKAGVVKWEDVVTPSRVRDLREVVAKKRLTVEQMTRAGVGKRWATEAHAAVNTPEHQLVEQKRRELLAKLTGAGLSQDKIVEALSEKLAQRVVIAEGPTGPYTEGPAWGRQTMPPPGGGHGGALAALLGGPPKKPRPPVKGTPVAAPAPPPRKPEEPVTVVPAQPAQGGEAIPPKTAEQSVVAAAEAVPDAKLWGHDAAFIHHVYEEYQANPANPRMTLDQFKAWIVNSPLRAQMHRADMVQKMNPADVAAASTPVMIGDIKVAEFHFVRVTPKGGYQAAMAAEKAAAAAAAAAPETPAAPTPKPKSKRKRPGNPQ